MIGDDLRAAHFVGAGQAVHLHVVAHAAQGSSFNRVEHDVDSARSILDKTFQLVRDDSANLYPGMLLKLILSQPPDLLDGSDDRRGRGWRRGEF